MSAVRPHQKPGDSTPKKPAKTHDLTINHKTNFDLTQKGDNIIFDEQTQPA